MIMLQVGYHIEMTPTRNLSYQNCMENLWKMMTQSDTVTNEMAPTPKLTYWNCKLSYDTHMFGGDGFDQNYPVYLYQFRLVVLQVDWGPLIRLNFNYILPKLL